MDETDATERLDRHALVMGIWSALGFVAAILLHYGLGAGGWIGIAAGYACLLAAFLGHVIVNAVYQTVFSRRELALLLVVFLASLVALCLAALLAPDFRDRGFVPLVAGLAAVAAVVLGYMTIHYGVRAVFDAFNVIGDFRPEKRSER